MKLKLFINLVFTFVGTAILIACTVIVVYNFIRDSRLFADPVPVVAQDKKTAEKTVKEDTEINIDRTQEYKRSNSTVHTIKPSKFTLKPSESTEPSPDIEPSSTPIEDTIYIRVEVINYSGIKQIAELVRETLEMHGYKVSAGNGKTNTPIVSQIIERNDSGAGTDLKRILNISNVIKIPDPQSRFDVTVIIGDDYKP